jgi:hypothetical protein
MSVETWVQLGVGILLTIIAPLLGELFWKSLAMTLAGFCFGVALWQGVESHDWYRGYFVAGCALLAVMLGSFIVLSAPKTVNSKTEQLSSTPAYPAKSPEQAAPNERDFVRDNITAEYLMSIFNEPGRTTVQGNTLVEPYIGKWMKVSGVMRDVRKNEFFSQMTFERNPRLERTDWLYYTDLYMLFRGNWIQRVVILRPGDRLTVIGQIERVSSIDLQLNNCELVDSK